MGLVAFICSCSCLTHFNKPRARSPFVKVRRYSKVTSSNSSFFSSVLFSHKQKVCNLFTFIFTSRAITVTPCCNHNRLASFLGFESCFLTLLLDVWIIFNHMIWKSTATTILWLGSTFKENFPLDLRSFLRIYTHFF